MKNSEQEQELAKLRDHAAHFQTLIQHEINVQVLLRREVKIVKLIVGAEKKVFECNRALLAYHSPYFEAAFFNGFQESESHEMILPEDLPKSIEVFILWTQTGIISLDTIYGLAQGSREFNDVLDNHNPWDNLIWARLWVLGDKLLCKAFCNSVMWYLLENLSTREIILSDEAGYIFENTIPGSKARKLVVDYVQSRGPFTMDKKGDYFKDWFEGIARGGELIQECVVAGGFHNNDLEAAPELYKNRHLYYEDEGEGKRVAAEEWRKGDF